MSIRSSWLQFLARAWNPVSVNWDTPEHSRVLSLGQLLASAMRLMSVRWQWETERYLSSWQFSASWTIPVSWIFLIPWKINDQASCWFYISQTMARRITYKIISQIVDPNLVQTLTIMIVFSLLTRNEKNILLNLVSTNMAVTKILGLFCMKLVTKHVYFFVFTKRQLPER